MLSSESSVTLGNYFSALAKTYGVKVDQIVSGFNPNSSVYPTFFNRGLAVISEDENHSLTEINVVMVEDRQGESFLWAGGTPCTSRTNMDNEDRETTSLLENPSTYVTKETQCDIHLPFGTIQKWSVSSKNKNHTKNQKSSFANKYTDFVTRRVVTDVLNIGFNGVECLEKTTPGKLLTGVNKGWIQIVKEQKPEQVLSDPLTIGLGGDYVNLDAAVADVLDTSIDLSLHEDLVCIISDNLISDERQKLYQSSEFHLEKKLTSDTFKHFGGLDRVKIPNFPSDTIVVTSLDNLSVYIKESTIFRQVVNNPKRNRVEDYQHREEAYIVENLSKFAAITDLKEKVA